MASTFIITSLVALITCGAGIAGTAFVYEELVVGPDREIIEFLNDQWGDEAAILEKERAGHAQAQVEWAEATQVCGEMIIELDRAFDSVSDSYLSARDSTDDFFTRGGFAAGDANFLYTMLNISDESQWDANNVRDSAIDRFDACLAG
jgi:hypothetical protein